jgi:transposase
MAKIWQFEGMKTPEDLFGELFKLGDAWTIERVTFVEGKGLLELYVRETPKLWEVERCPHDGSSGVVCYDHVGEVRWRHLNVFGKEAEIVCNLPRGRCPKCGKVWRVTPPWEGRAKHFTKEFEAFALTLMREMPVKKAADILGEQDTRMWRILQAYVDEAYAAVDMSDVYCVGVDEMSRAKGQRYLTVFADLMKKAVLFATPGKDSATWGEFVTSLAAHNGHPHALTSVSMDMSQAYAKGVRENCRNAKIVYDKFHVIAHANDAVDWVRRDETRSGRAAAREALAKSRWIWLKNPENLTEKEQKRLSRIDQEMLQTARAYQMRLALQEIYELNDVVVATQRFAEWCRWVREESGKEGHWFLKHMTKVADLIESHLKGILAHWDHGVTNAFKEGLNSVFSAVRRKARGYRTIRNMIAMLYFVAGKLPSPAMLIHWK